LRVDPQPAALPLEGEEQVSVRSNLEAKEVSDIFYFVGSRPRNPWATIGSFALLSVLLLALIAIPLFHTDPLPKREQLTMLYLQPPAAAAGNAVTFQPFKPASTYSSTSIAVPTVHKTEEAPPPPVETSDGLVDGVPGGVVGGIPGGVLSEVLSSTPSVPAPAKMSDPTPVKRIRVASRVVEANLIHDVTPKYPPEAGRARIEGAVVLLALIATDGSVKDLRVESGLPILAQAAIDAVKQWRYKPYMVGGEAVEVDSRITINFTLSAS
jgi:protein TonB